MCKKILVGYTGFVGSNIMNDTYLGFNSKNIDDAFDKQPDLLVYAGVTAEKFLANTNPEKDLNNIKNAYNNIIRINPKKIVLISTIDVYSDKANKDESSNMIENPDNHYGNNRLYLENLLLNKFGNNIHIIRLPALYGKNLKKNFIFDIINLIPSKLSEAKFIELSKCNNLLISVYKNENNGFYSYQFTKHHTEIKEYFKNSNFNALSFTNSENIYQFYPLKYLNKHIDIAIKNNLRVVNLFTEPLSAKEIYKSYFGSDFDNKTNNTVKYNLKTKYFEIYSGNNGYIFDKDFIIKDIINFIKENDNEALNF